MAKYEMTNEGTLIAGALVYRIRALEDFGDVKSGDLGGYIEHTHNLSQVGDCWIYDNAVVVDNAIIFGDAEIRGAAIVSDDAKVYGKATVAGNSWIFGKAEVYDDAMVTDSAWVYGRALVHGNAIICDDAQVRGKAWVHGNALVCDNTAVHGNCVVYGNAQVRGTTEVRGDTELTGGNGVDEMYDIIESEFIGFDAIYEDAIVQLIGSYGLDLLEEHRLVETCGVVNGRQLYVLCGKE